MCSVLLLLVMFTNPFAQPGCVSAPTTNPTVARFMVQVDLQDLNDGDGAAASTETRDVLAKRMAFYGLGDAVFDVQDTGAISVDLINPVYNVEELRGLLSRPGRLEFREKNSSNEW